MKVSKRKYDKMCKESNFGSEGSNVYSCEMGCGNTLFTHKDKGVTPMFMRCKCGARSTSSFYRNITIEKMNNVIETREWYRPDYKEAKKLEKKYPGMMEHLMQGGLTDRIVK